MSETASERVPGHGAGTAVVVGAGVGGLATAVGLRRAGWEVTVLERPSAAAAPSTSPSPPGTCTAS